LQDYLPGPIFALEPPPDTASSTKRKKTSHAKPYRPVKEHPVLDYRLIKWLEHVHFSDPFHSLRPVYYILSDTHRMNLTRAHPNDIKTPSDVTQLLNENAKWALEWEKVIFDIIRD
jgi:hypothetical protein